jgi:phosphoglycerate dehydrogenase-like enzyme
LWILVPSRQPYLDELDGQALLAERFEQVIISGSYEELEASQHPHVVLVGPHKEIGGLLERLWHKMDRLQWIHSMAAGLEHFLFPQLVDSAVVLTNAKGLFAEALGEYTIFACLYFAKTARRLIENQRAHRWDSYPISLIGDRTLGIIGYGGIGQAAARRAKAMDMRVLALRRHFDPTAREPWVDASYRNDQLDEMIPACDYILIAAPLTPETRGMITAARLALMKPTAVLINLGRGAIVDEEALVTALQQRTILGAALDVFAHEPLPAEHPFWALENVLLSPHNADRTDDFMHRSARFFLTNLRRLGEQQALLNIVNKQLGY